MRKISSILLCLALAGCAGVTKNKTIDSLNVYLSQKDAQILKLQALLVEKEELLKEKDLKIEELKKKLAGFGVF